MYVGTQFGARHETDIRQLAQLGVEHVDVPLREHWKEWTVDLLVSYREKYAKYGINVETIHSPLGSRDAFTNDMTYLFLGPSDEKERELDSLCEIIRMASEAGLRGLLYNITILGHLRTPPRYGRGGATLSSFKYADLDQSLPEFEGGAADADTMWERIDYFLSRIMPVAEEYEVQMACHPQDPGIKDNEYRGASPRPGHRRRSQKFDRRCTQNPSHASTSAHRLRDAAKPGEGSTMSSVLRSRKKISTSLPQHQRRPRLRRSLPRRRRR